VEFKPLLDGRGTTSTAERVVTRDSGFVEDSRVWAATEMAIDSPQKITTKIFIGLLSVSLMKMRLSRSLPLSIGPHNAQI
jgi:hypothetical protein